MISRAAFARRLPLAASAANCVSRTRTIASSAATKNPFITTRARTATIFKPLSVSASQFMLQTHLAENKFQDIRQRNDSDFATIAPQDNRESLAAALHPLQGAFEPHILFHI